MSGFVIGTSHLAKSDTERPEFEIVRRDGWKEPEADVRACAHGNFILDEQWATVTCGRCREKVDPFSALMYYAVNFAETRRAYDRMVEAEKDLHVAELKRLGRLRDASEENQSEIRKLTGWGFKGTAKDLREAVRRIEREISDRKFAKIAKKSR